MAIGLFFLILAILLAVAMPVGGVFGLMAMLPNLLNSSFSYAAGDVARGMFAGLNSFTLLAVPLFMVSGMIMAQVGIVMGSDSDMPVMAKAADILEELGISYEMTIISAHREPDVFFEYAKSAESKGFKVIIAGAGMAAHLPGICAAIFPMPVIGIPMHTTSLGGRDSLYSIVQMPSGIPVATVAINGGANAGLLAAKILATSDEALLARLKEYSAKLKSQVEAKDAKLQEVGYKKYLEK